METARVSRLFEALSHRYRRIIIVRLAESAQWDLAVLQSAAEFSTDLKWDDVRSQLFHNHLPKLAADGFINWKREARTITRGPNFEEILRILASLERRRDAETGIRHHSD